MCLTFRKGATRGGEDQHQPVPVPRLGCGVNNPPNAQVERRGPGRPRRRSGVDELGRADGAPSARTNGSAAWPRIGRVA